MILLFFLLFSGSCASPPETEVEQTESKPQPSETPVEIPQVETQIATEEKPEPSMAAATEPVLGRELELEGTQSKGEGT